MRYCLYTDTTLSICYQKYTDLGSGGGGLKISIILHPRQIVSDNILVALSLKQWDFHNLYIIKTTLF